MAADRKSNTRRNEDVDVLERVETKKPKKFKVVLLNDDYTSMEFVVGVLIHVFRHTPPAATRIMLRIHQTGQGVAGVYSQEIAETRMATVQELANEAGHPLQCVMEPE